jgi:hypothetical protein
MKISYSSWIRQLNSRLAKAGQTIRVIEYGQNQLKLSNGLTLSGNEFTRFKKRVMNPKTNLWLVNVDKLFNGLLIEADIKSMISRIGGIACQQLHGDRIKKNLNTGTPFNKGTKGQKIGQFGTRSQQVKDAISKKNSGINNGMYGHQYSVEERNKKSNTMKAKILSGEFTPNSNNRNTHWNSTYRGEKFRSSWEALYRYYNNDAEYEKLRIKYIDNNIERVYIVDFVDYKNKLVVEVKPKELLNKKFERKQHALQLWCQENNFTLVLATQDWLIEHITVTDYSEFDTNTERKIRKLYETNQKSQNR